MTIDCCWASDVCTRKKTGGLHVEVAPFLVRLLSTHADAFCVVNWICILKVLWFFLFHSSFDCELPVTIFSFSVDELASRLEHLSAFSFHWARREQQPHPERGTCDVSCIHAIYVSADEAAHAIAHLDPKEYAQIAYVDFDSVIAADSKFHPAVQRAVHGILDRRRFRALEAAITSTAAQDDQAIVKLAREYVRGKQSVTSGDRVPIKTLDFL
jgi:hypothetical protein